ncbi:hypothetical protein POM88_052693 [Heracleum sosnowskyi]|uniref:Uncharacterized protein n=1 Tax=Heracleum sosnowskyi TaxID=360622 RepID=A0AAD8GRH8_9APIA|nr:hypothetical protein POM88_052693 [Heracleum sosnowskyi]
MDIIDKPFDVCVHRFLCGTGKYGMIVFDLHKEVLNCSIKLHVIIRDDEDEEEEDKDEVTRIIEFKDEDTRIIEFNKSIVVIMLWDKGRNDDHKINMWMLDDDACLGGGVEASWTPMFSIDLSSIDLAKPALLILGYFNNRDLLLLTCHVWISCNGDKKDAKIVPISVEMDGHGYKYSNAV